MVRRNEEQRCFGLGPSCSRDPLPLHLPLHLQLLQYGLAQLPGLAVIGGTLACGILLDVEQCRAVGAVFGFLWLCTKLAEFDWHRRVREDCSPGWPTRASCMLGLKSGDQFWKKGSGLQALLAVLPPLQSGLRLGGASLWFLAMGGSVGRAHLAARLCAARRSRAAQRRLIGRAGDPWGADD